MTATFHSLGVFQFRSWESARLTLDSRPVVLHGPNGAGKTNLLEAVSLFSPGRGLRRAKAETLARREGGGGWRLKAEIETPTQMREVTLSAAPEGRITVEIDGKTTSRNALGALAPMLWLTPAMDRLWIEGAEARRRFLDRSALSFDPDHAGRSLAYEKAMRERNRLLRDGRADPAWLGLLEARMAEAGVAISRARDAAAARLMEAQRGAKTLFPQAEITIVTGMDAELEASMRAGEAQALRAALANSRREDAAAGRSLTGPHRADLEAVYIDKRAPAAQCSTGEQKALLISLLLANARALKTDRGTAPTLLLDELAAHLDTKRRESLFDEICALGAQAWMTGVGPEPFAALGDRARRFAAAERGGVSVLHAA